jgi:hypothetical protein
MKWLVVALALAGCAGDGAPIAMSFARASFYDAPFPSDDLRRADGTIDVSKIPNPNHVELIHQALALLASDARGFALAGGVYFRAGATLDPATLDGNVLLIELGSGKRVPLDVAFLDDGGPFGDKNLIAALPIQGVPLRPKTRYAAAVTRAVHDLKHRALARSTEMVSIAAGRKPAALSDEVFVEYRDALAKLPSDVVAMTVFTTDDPTAALAVVRDDALASHPIVPPSTAAALGTVYADYCVYGATIQVPVYQTGAPPYDKTGGGWIFDGGGKPTFDHFETSRMVFTIPRAPMPASGWPTVVFVRTGGGGDNPLVDRGASLGSEFTMPVVPGSGPARELARIGFAGVQIDGPLGGMRNTTMGNEDFLIFNVFNAAALRDNVRQSAMELSLLARIIPSLTFDSSGCSGGSARFDGAHLALMGHSMGAWIAPLVLAVEPRYGAAVLSGAGGSYIANVMDKIKPLHVKPYLEIFLDYNMDQRSLEAHDPALTLVQWAAEPSDPQVYDRVIVREPAAGESPRHVLMEQGIVDHYILPSIANATSLALGLDAAGPLYDAGNAEEQSLAQVPLAQRLPLVGGKMLTLPVRGNAGAATAVVVQHNGDTIEDGHEVMFQTEAPKHQYRCFLQSWLGGVPTVPVDDAADAPCP